MRDRQDQWRHAIELALAEAQQQGENWRIEVEFFTALLALLDGHAQQLPADHPYRPALDEILAGLARKQQM